MQYFSLVSPPGQWTTSAYAELKVATLVRRDLFDATVEDDPGAFDCICTD